MVPLNNVRRDLGYFSKIMHYNSMVVQHLVHHETDITSREKLISEELDHFQFRKKSFQFQTSKKHNSKNYQLQLLVSSKMIDSAERMLEHLPLGPVDSYIHPWFFSTGIFIQSFPGKYIFDSYASVTSVICK